MTGDYDAALASLRFSSPAQRSFGPMVNLDPRWPLRSDPRFQSLLAKYSPRRSSL